MKKYRLEITTAAIVLSVVFCYMAWSAQGHFDRGFLSLFSRQEPVRHKDTGEVLLTATTRRKAVEEHVGRVRRRWIQLMQRAGTRDAGGPPPEPGMSRDAIRRYMEDSLSGADLRAVDFSGADLSGVYLRGARCEGANLQRAELFFARLEGIDLAGARLDGAKLGDASLVGANLRGVSCAGTDFNAAKLREADLSGSDISGASFTGADCQGADFSGVIWDSETRFEGANLTGARNLPDGLRELARKDGAELGSTGVAASHMEASPPQIPPS